MYVGLVLAHRYELIERLGAGGMGSVWRAHDRTLDAEVAVKLIDPLLVESPTANARFRQEAQAAATIRSTYVVQILDHGVDRGVPFIAMELLRGESLAARLKKQGQLAPEMTARLMAQVARALALAHAHGIVHRDLKPENIYLVSEDEEDIAKVLDFGVARRNAGLGASAALKTKTGSIIGTPHYMSPEQATGQSVDHLTDIWSFGVIACECLSGKRVFSGDSLGSLFHSICMARMPVPSQSGVPLTGFDGWFSRAACRDTSLRFQSIKEAADELRSICAQPKLRSSTPDELIKTHDTVVTAPPGDCLHSTPPEWVAPSAMPIPVSTGGASTQTTAVQAIAPVLPTPALLRRKASRMKLIISVAASLSTIGAAWVGVRWVSRETANASRGSGSEPSSANSLSSVTLTRIAATASQAAPSPRLDPSAGPAARDATAPSPVKVSRDSAKPKLVPAAKPSPTTSARTSTRSPSVNGHTIDDNAAGI